MRRSVEIAMPGTSLAVFLVAFASVLFAGCVSAPAAIREREAYWRRVLAEQAPAGTERADVIAVFERQGLMASEGTYRTVHDDGSETSHCRLPDRALSALERGSVRGLYVDWDIEVTLCLDENDRVEDYFVGAWNAGI